MSSDVTRSSSRERSSSPEKDHVPPRDRTSFQQRIKQGQEHRAEVVDPAQVEDDLRLILALERLEDQLGDRLLQAELDPLELLGRR